MQEILAYARNKQDVWNSVGAGATSGFISFAAYGGPRFGVFGTIIMSTVGFLVVIMLERKLFLQR